MTPRYSRQVFLIFIITLVMLNKSYASDNTRKDRAAYIDSLIAVSKSIDSYIKAEEYYKITIYFFQQDSLFAANDYAKKGIWAAEEEKKSLLSDKNLK